MSHVPSALVVAAGVTLALAGCSAPTVQLGETSGTVQSVRALELGWRTAASQPEWVPDDATDIRFSATTSGPADETPAIVRVTSASPLPAACTTRPRSSAVALREGWAPRSVPDRVERCGNWAVVRVPGGWYGWTPFDPVGTS